MATMNPWLGLTPQEQQMLLAQQDLPIDQVPLMMPQSSTVDERTQMKMKASGAGLMPSSDYNTAIGRLNARELESLKAQGVSIDELKGRLSATQSQELPLDLTPLAALVDTWTGSNLAQTYRPPETKKERQAAVDRLQQQILQAQQGLSENEIAMLRSQLNNQFQMENMLAQAEKSKQAQSLEREKLDILRKQAEGKIGQPSEAEKTVDRKFGAMYADDVLQGGFRTSDKDIAELENTLNQVEASKVELSGPMIGSTPAVIRNKTYPEAVAAQQQIEKAIQGSMRATLGSQFTEKEGRQILERTFDPSLPTEVNLQRARSVVEGLKRAREAKLKAIDYYEQTGTMRGFKGATNYEDAFKSDMDKAITKEKPKFTREEIEAELKRRQK